MGNERDVDCDFDTNDDTDVDVDLNPDKDPLSRVKGGIHLNSSLNSKNYWLLKLVNTTMFLIQLLVFLRSL